MPTSLPDRGPHRGGHYWRTSTLFQQTWWWEPDGTRQALAWMDFDELLSAAERMMAHADRWFEIVTASSPRRAAALAEDLGVEADHDVPTAAAWNDGTSWILATPLLRALLNEADRRLAARRGSA